MFRKRKTVPPHFRIPVPFNPIPGQQGSLFPQLRPYCRFKLKEALTTSTEKASAEIEADRFQWGPGMHHLIHVEIVVHNLPNEDESGYEFQGEVGDTGFAAWDFDTNWRIIHLGSSTTGGGNKVAITTDIIPGRTGSVAGGPISVQPMKLDDSSPPEFVNDGDPVDVYSWVKADSSDPADEDNSELYIFIEQDEHSTWWFTGQDCPPGGDT